MDPITLARTALLMLANYFRWTQAIPMVLAWSALVGVLLVFVFVNFQQEGMTVLEYVGALLERYPRLAPLFDLGDSDENGTWRLDSERWRERVLAAWALISLVLWVADEIRAQLFGSRAQWSLSRGMKRAAKAAVGFWLLFVLIYAVSSETFQGSAAGWLLMFAGLCLIPVAASAYSLTIATLISSLSAAISRSMLKLKPV